MANLITTNLTVGGASPIVNLDNVLQVSKVGSAFIGSDGNPSQSQSRFGILFTFTGQGKNPQDVTWRYESETDRNNDFNAILANNNSLGNLFRTNLTSGGQSPIVNLSNVLQVSKYTSTFTGSNGNPSAAQNSFVTLLTFKGQGQNPQSLELKYDSATNRNNDYALILSQQVTPGGLTYKVYSALLTSSSGTITAQVLQNTLGTINWTVPSNANIRGTLSGSSFVINKTMILCTSSIGGYIMSCDTPSTSFVRLLTTLHDGTTTATPNFTNLSIEIRLYN